MIESKYLCIRVYMYLLIYIKVKKKYIKYLFAPINSSCRRVVIITAGIGSNDYSLESNDKKRQTKSNKVKIFVKSVYSI
ncbi:hypothetical protein BX659_1278 [Orenia metallireducens]|uniref:Uncharacterized protein n=1 Tax=Orenia metallireducens TaxID=1413210 RepID=A0A285I3A6_9FIRM|nr:hypothetical protein BX659_1278 [Orenia metallireducens]SNY42383.1 hypothetical protein SAMN06265827_1308 [Orenia metallireducens]